MLQRYLAETKLDRWGLFSEVQSVLGLWQKVILFELGLIHSVAEVLLFLRPFQASVSGYRLRIW